MNVYIYVMLMMTLSLFADVSKEYKINNNGISKTVVVSGLELKIYETAEKIYKKIRSKRIKAYNRNVVLIAKKYNKCVTTANDNFRINGQAFYMLEIDRCTSVNKEANRNNVYIELSFIKIVNELKRINKFTNKPAFDPGLNDPTVGDAGCDDPDY